ncbi:hypothetical protein AP1H75_05600 [Apilactobacillus apinorum]|uniref:DUF5776 domain-containing protein n=1 Tax=Apilactobacillus apinorum TaxID=1218495 RepID=UPI0030E8A2E5
MKKITQFSFFAASSLLFVSAGTNVVVHADGVPDIIGNALAKVQSGNNANNTTTTATSANNANNTTTTATSANNADSTVSTENSQSTYDGISFDVIATHSGFQYQDATLKGDQVGAYDNGDKLTVVGVQKNGNKLRYEVLTPNGKYFISAYYTKLADDKDASVKDGMVAIANHNFFTVVATHDGIVYTDKSLSSDKQISAYNNGDTFNVVKVVKDGNKLRYVVQTETGFYYISAYHTKLAANGNAAQYKAMRAAVATVKATAKKTDNSAYYTTVKKGNHVAVVKKTLVQHPTKTFKDNAAKTKKNTIKKGKKLSFNSIVKVGNTYRLHLTNGKYVTASKQFVNIIK